ncbi:MAG TPA: hypothetical protein PKZ00_03925 [Elusimicrobiota bacterium]|nr:hypothetical protein [Elusimicrobiota bacterium]
MRRVARITVIEAREHIEREARYERPNGLVLSFDYAFLWPLNIQGTSGSHRATLGVRF